jgi:hypothetical protein
LIGWNIEQFTACVACVIDESLVPLSRLELSVSLLMEDQALADLWQHCHGHPIVLGKWTNSTHASTLSPPPPETQRQSDRILFQRRRDANFWLELAHDPKTSAPTLLSVFCCGFKYRTASQIFIFDRPKPEFFFLRNPGPSTSFNVAPSKTILPSPSRWRSIKISRLTRTATSSCPSTHACTHTRGHNNHGKFSVTDCHQHCIFTVLDSIAH